MFGLEGLEASATGITDLDDWSSDSPPRHPDFDLSADNFGSHFGAGHNGHEPLQHPPNPNRHHPNLLQSPLPGAIPSLAAPITTPESNPSSFQDSSSGSSRHARGFRSTQASLDTAMTDVEETKDPFDYQQYLNIEDDEDGSSSPSDTVDPHWLHQSPGEQQARPGSSSFKNEAPSPVQVKPDPTTSPKTRAGHSSLLPRASKSRAGGAPRGHNKASSHHSLIQSMSELNALSREVSPTEHYTFSQGASPLSTFGNSPVSAAEVNFMAGMDAADNPYHGLPMMDPNDPVAQFSQALNPSIPPGLFPQSSNHFNPAMGLTPYAMDPQQTGPGLGNWSAPAPLGLRIEHGSFKSRVETQIPITMRVSNLPPHIERLHLQVHTVGKPKYLIIDEIKKERDPKPSPDMLELHVMLVCTSSMGTEKNKKAAFERARVANRPPAGSTADVGEEDDGDYRICTGCVQREQKRADRKKHNKLPVHETKWKLYEKRRIVMFNEYEVQQFKRAPWKPSPPKVEKGQTKRPPAPFPLAGEGMVTVPMRIACYCRHHNEKQGFQVIFTMKDWQGNFVCQAISNPIMITDDHKTHPPTDLEALGSNDNNASLPTPPATNPSATPPSLSPQIEFRGSRSTSDLAALQRGPVQNPPSISHPSHAQPNLNANMAALARTLSRPPSPNSLGAPVAKRRKGSGSRVPNELAMTRLETAPLSTTQSAVNMGALATSSATSPFAQSQPILPMAAPDVALNQAMSFMPPSTNFFMSPTTPNGNRDMTYSAPPSKHTSRASSPNGVGVSPPPTMPMQMPHVAMSTPSGNYGPPTPVLLKVVPAEGSKSGAYEVTILGANFYQGLEVMFGDQMAIATTFWGARSLLAVVPAAHTAGMVNVTLRHSDGQPAPHHPSHDTTMFRYVDDDEQQLMRTALAVLSKKWNNADIPGVARHIINSSNWGNSAQGSGAPTGHGGQGFNGFSSQGSTLEMQLLKLCEVVDMDDSPTKAEWDLRNSKTTGQTMLHLASALGFQRLVAGLLARGANPDVRDKAGYTPMHLATLNKHSDIVRRLVHAGADPTIRTLSGLTHADMAPISPEALDTSRQLQRHFRSRSAGSLYSRASSATSLKSLREAANDDVQPANDSVEASDGSDDSIEYSQPSTSEEEDDVEEAEWLNMRRSSIHSRRAQEATPAPIDPSADELVPAALASPAIATLREQLAHLQHFVSQHMQTSINMPNPLPDYYRPYFNTNALQRMSALVPSIGARPGSPNNGAGAKDMAAKWWDLTSLIPNYNAPPPAYEEISSDQVLLDTKQATAAGAAADAEADAKCAALFDQPTETTEEVTEPVASTSAAAAQEVVTTTRELPSIIQIGPKKSITKETQDKFRYDYGGKQKGLKSDTKLFWVWIPMLLLIFVSALQNQFPQVFKGAMNLIWELFTWAVNSPSPATVEGTQPPPQLVGGEQPAILPAPAMA